MSFAEGSHDPRRAASMRWCASETSRHDHQGNPEEKGATDAARVITELR
jgi:hypothetical protein